MLNLPFLFSLLVLALLSQVVLAGLGKGSGSNNGLYPISYHFKDVSLKAWGDDWIDTQLWSYRYNSDVSNIFDLWDGKSSPGDGEEAGSPIPLNALELCVNETTTCSDEGVWKAISNPHSLPHEGKVVFDIGAEIQLKFKRRDCKKFAREWDKMCQNFPVNYWDYFKEVIEERERREIYEIED
jgi:hypothetical protein